MRKRIHWAMAVVLAMASPALYALGLGSAKVNSYLNQPLDVRVELISQSSEELQSITAGLASAKDFELLGLKLNAISVPLQFEVISEGDQPYIHITSLLNVTDPVMQVLVEVVWANGRMLREYTLFLDPPTLGSKAPAPAVSKAPKAASPASVESTTSMPPAEKAVPQPEIEQKVPEDDVIFANNLDSSVSSSQQQLTGDKSTEVGKGQTLWGIASDWSKGTGYSVNQAMLAIQRKNPDAFIDNNINLLKQGEILRMPASSEMAEITSQQAALEVLRQGSDFNASLGMADYDTPTLADSGYQDSSTADVPDDVESNDGRLELVPPADNTDDGVGAISQASDEVTSGDVIEQVLQEKLSRTEEDLVNAELENNYLKERIAELEQAAKEAERLQIEDADLANMEVAQAEKLASNEPEPKIAITPGGEKQPWYAGATIWIVAVALLLILLIVWFLRRRSLMKSASQQDIENKATVQAVAEEAEDLLDILDNYGASTSTRKVVSHADENAVEVDADDMVPTSGDLDVDTDSGTDTRVIPTLVPDAPQTDIESGAESGRSVEPDEPAIRLPDESMLDNDEIEDKEEITLLDESEDITSNLDEAQEPATDDEESNDPELKLDLARAYLSLGDKEAAKSMLDEVMNSGDDDQKAEARQMLEEL